MRAVGTASRREGRARTCTGCASFVARADGKPFRRRRYPQGRWRFAYSSPSSGDGPASTGRVLWALRPHRRRPIASTTKIMTALLALQRLPLHGLVRVAPQATQVPLVKEGLRPREQVRVWKLLYSLLLYSGNDDATALAIAAGGSRPGFLVMMNGEARRLGLSDTHFNSPSGAQIGRASCRERV